MDGHEPEILGVIFNTEFNSARILAVLISVIRVILVSTDDVLVE